PHAALCVCMVVLLFFPNWCSLWGISKGAKGGGRAIASGPPGQRVAIARPERCDVTIRVCCGFTAGNCSSWPNGTAESRPGGPCDFRPVLPGPDGDRRSPEARTRTKGPRCAGATRSISKGAAGAQD